jgi:hypothetical protein
MQSLIPLYIKLKAKIADKGDSASMACLILILDSNLLLGNRKRKDSNE